jgi:hypothetical protein
MKSQDEFEWVDHTSECIDPSRGRQRCGNSSDASGCACLEAAARAELGFESDDEWAEARANLLVYVRLLLEWQERSGESGTLAGGDLPDAA